MNKLDSNRQEGDEVASDEAPAGTASDVGEIDSKKGHKGNSDTARLKSQLREAEEEVKEFKDKYLRAVADLQNYRKRVRKEIQAAYESSGDRLLCDILPVIDNLERALDPSHAGDADAFRDGVRMILGMLKAVLEDEGVTEFCSVGERFDPTKHEAVYAVDSGEVPADVVVDEMEKGYMMKDRLLRPARVTVSRGTCKDPGGKNTSVFGETDTGGGE